MSSIFAVSHFVFKITDYLWELELWVSKCNDLDSDKCLFSSLVSGANKARKDNDTLWVFAQMCHKWIGQSELWLTNFPQFSKKSKGFRKEAAEEKKSQALFLLLSAEAAAINIPIQKAVKEKAKCVTGTFEALLSIPKGCVWSGAVDTSPKVLFQ